jgi:23S rRNA (cytidine1920-2'-O)/16S rRNA (cytidine1409-2'-O)-methyltransferase
MTSAPASPPDTPPKPSAKQRLDVALVSAGLVATRTQAQALIMAGQVTLNGQKADKAGQPVDLSNDELAINDGGQCPYVSRGGLKLAKALEVFALPVAGRTAIDVGSSTGGFTDCLLQHNARHVYAVDVGYGQLDWHLRQDPRVTVMERTNARHLTVEQFHQPPSVLVCDVSFISLKKVLPATSALLRPDEGDDPAASALWMMALLKPQFECLDYLDPAAARRFDGVVRDPAQRMLIADGVLRDLHALLPGWGLAGLAQSPITGAKGNVEWLTWWQPDVAPIDWRALLPDLVGSV